MNCGWEWLLKEVSLYLSMSPPFYTSEVSKTEQLLQDFSNESIRGQVINFSLGNWWREESHNLCGRKRHNIGQLCSLSQISWLNMLSCIRQVVLGSITLMLFESCSAELLALLKSNRLMTAMPCVGVFSPNNAAKFLHPEIKSPDKTASSQILLWQRSLDCYWELAVGVNFLTADS